VHEFYSTVSPEGRVTIPRAIRRMLNLRASDRVEFRVVDGRITIAPVRSVLAEHYQSVPPLKTSLTPEEVVGLAIDEQVEEAASEGLR